MEGAEERTCVGCRARAPASTGDFTLISGRFGWRLMRQVLAGRVILEWRCPTCWARYKQERALAMTPADGVPAVSAPDSKPESKRDGIPSSRRKPV